MEARRLDLYRVLAKHFAMLCRIPVTVVDTAERSILFTENRAENFFCNQCPNHCRLLATMLYGCNEARRWNGRYVYYCPIGLVFNAVSIPETEHTVIAGPVVMGEIQDTLLDMPSYIDTQEIRRLQVWSADMLNHMTSLLEMSVYGLRYRPDVSSYDRNIIPSEDMSFLENAELFNGFPYVSEQEEALRYAVKVQDKAKAREVLNQLLRYVYSPHPDQVALIRSRAIQLVYLLSKVAAIDGAGTETALYRSVYIPTLKNAATLEELDVSLAEVLHHFVDYAFDFSEIKHSDVIYRIMEYIKSNYSKKITLEEIAAQVYLSGPHISAMFRKETGQTISEYIQYVRIEKSKILLRQTALSLADVAAMCGFEDQSYFSRVFKKQTEISPKKYRANALDHIAIADTVPQNGD